ncbi:hypothetical protein [Kitasatospora sp. NPDC001547]|uniref:hypothetical protein n=1 Tax=Kitasatospora sp. NPDC001547 TaxID=3364015 RepID=UPI00367D43CC|nr:hypothetical protein KitaXyl93_00350 [Kitasatospora sp. Xyl93]
MNSWINLNALWKIIVVGLLAGAGLPALFAVGVRALNPPSRPGKPTTGRLAAGPIGRTVAALCFAVVLAAVGWGMAVIVHHG